jgi:hypothetical protein
MLSVWEKRRQEKGSPMVISTTIFSLLITTGDSFLRPHDQAYHQEMIVSIFDLYGYNIYYMGGELSLRSSHFTTFSILMIKI